MPFSLVAHTIKGIAVQGNGGIAGAHTDAINTAGADFLIGVVGEYGAGTTFSDNYGHTWQPLIYWSIGSGTGTGVRIFYTETDSANVGPGHTFWTTSPSPPAYTTVQVSAWSGRSSIAGTTFYSQNGNTTIGAPTLSAGATGAPSKNGALIVSACCINGATTLAVSSPLTILDQVTYAIGQWQGLAVAYVIQSSISGQTPVWTTLEGAEAAADVALFEPESGVAVSRTDGQLRLGKL